VRRAMPTWKDVSTTTQHCVRGGMLTSPAVIDTCDVHVGEVDGIATKITFIKLASNSMWIRQCVVGMKATRTCLSRSRLVNELSRKLAVRDADYGEHNPSDTEVADDEHDPMSELHLIAPMDVTPPPKKKKAAVAAYKRRRAADYVTRVDMPSRCPLAATGLPATTTTITLWRKSGRGWNRVPYLNIDDLPWFIAWMRCEWECQGVAMIRAPTTPGVPPATSPDAGSAVADEPPPFTTAWDFAATAWTCRFQDGSSISAKVDQLTPEKVAAVAADMGVEFDAMSYIQKKDATLMWAEHNARIRLTH
jgi:hypothetical protein